MIEPLTVPDRDFELLAAGGGDARTMAALLVGQFSRRLLLLQAVLTATRHRAPAAVPALEPAYTLLAEVQRTHPDLVREVLLLPRVGNWATACLHDSGDTRSYGYLGCLAVSAAFRARTGFEIDVPVLDGEVCLPTLGTAALDGRPRTALVTADAGRGLTVRAGQAIVRVPREGSGAGAEPGWRPARRLRATAGEHRLAPWLDDSGPFRAPPGPPLTRSLVSAEDADRWERLLGEAWQLLTRRHPADAPAMAATLQALIPLRPSTDAQEASATAANAVGAVLLTPPRQAENLALTLLHEFQHGKLAALEHLVRLHAADPQARYYAPWRRDPRPLGALLHGAYAFLGVAGYWHARLTDRDASGENRVRAVAEKQLAYWSAAVQIALRQIAETGTLTAAGRRLTDGMATASARLGQAAGPAARSLAAERLRHDRLAWLARNETVRQGPPQPPGDAIA